MIAVTGANGLLGNFIVRGLAAEGHHVIAVMRKTASSDFPDELMDKISIREADVRDVPALTVALSGASTVIHTAAMVSFNPRRRKKIMEVNVGGTGNVVDVCLQIGIPNLVHISSVAALGRQKGIEAADENSKWADSNLNSDYAVSKYLAELEVFRGKEEGLNVSLVNPSVILAPSDWKKSSAQLFSYVWSGKKFYTRGSLNYVDVRDVVAMVMKVAAGNYNGERFIANAGTVSFRDFFAAVAKRFGKRPPSILVGAPWTGIFGWLEEVRAAITGNDPLVTRQSARLAEGNFYFGNDKAKAELAIQFRTLEESLDWCCSAYLRKINTNK